MYRPHIPDMPGASLGCGGMVNRSWPAPPLRESTVGGARKHEGIIGQVWREERAEERVVGRAEGEEALQGTGETIVATTSLQVRKLKFERGLDSLRAEEQARDVVRRKENTSRRFRGAPSLSCCRRATDQVSD